MKKERQIIDASKKPLGRVASEVAILLLGKNKTDYEPNVDKGEAVTVKNIEDISFTGNKKEDKIYYHHTGYPGGLKEISYERLTKKDRTLALKKAVYGMLPKNKLRKERIKKLKIE